MDVTRSVASPSEDIKKAAVFEKDALLSAQTMIYVRGRRPARVPPHAVDAIPATRHRRDTPSTPCAIDATMVPLLPLLTGRCPRRSTSAKHATKLLEEGG